MRLDSDICFVLSTRSMSLEASKARADKMIEVLKPLIHSGLDEVSGIVFRYFLPDHLEHLMEMKERFPIFRLDRYRVIQS